MSNPMADLLAAFGGAPEGENQKRSFGPSNYYPFYDMKTGQKAIIRFLPDKNTKNSRKFLVEQVFHNLTINGKKSKVPCLSQYGEDCPVCKISQEYYKAEGKDSPNGKKYWKKKQYIGQILVVEDPLPANDEGETHQGKVRYITLGFQIYNIIKEAFASTDDPLAAYPYNFEDGYDFIIKKTTQGEHASYSVGTKFHSKQRALSDEEVATAEEGMIDLSTLLSKNPGFEVTQAKLNADLNGEEYKDPGKAPVKPAAAKPAVKPSFDEEDEAEVVVPTVAKPVVKATPTPTVDVDEASDVDDMLAQIRARRQNK